MRPKTEKLLVDALNLPKEARAFMAEKLLESLDFEDEFDVSSEWRKEIQRRCRELDEGKAKLISGDHVFKELKDKIG
ncbi:MAG: addiction module protein [Planctomycetes bacterium]|nr:addiction module protein [Planctomycetota bacterium]